jgi:acid phosphatase type 7
MTETILGRHGAWGAVTLAALSWQCRDADITVTHLIGGASGVASSLHSRSIDASSEQEDASATPEASAGSLSLTEQLDLACGSGALTPSAGSLISRRPYIQNVTATSAVVQFTTREPMPPATLHVMAPGGAMRDVVAETDPADATGRQYRALLTDLEPATAYCYQVEDWTVPVGFRTAPTAGSPGTVRFLAFGDSGGDSRQVVRQGMDRVPFDLMLHAGDIAYMRGTLSEFESTFFETYADLIARIPIFPASGNHEYWTRDAAPYREVFALPENGAPAGVERWYSFDWGAIHFIALDTERVGSEQTDWLEQDLSRNVLGWKVAYLHRPPYSSGMHGSALDVREAFSPLFERFGVQLVIAGHEHNYERTKPIAGVSYVVSGGGGFGLRVVGSSDFTAYSESAFHVLHGELQGDSLWLRALDPAGRVIDSVRIPRDR